MLSKFMHMVTVVLIAEQSNLWIVKLMREVAWATVEQFRQSDDGHIYDLNAGPSFYVDDLLLQSRVLKTVPGRIEKCLTVKSVELQQCD